MRAVLATVALASFLTVTMPVSAAVPQETDLTSQFASAKLGVTDLRAFEIGGIVVLRGSAETKAAAEAAGVYAQSLGYTRVANLVRVVEAPDDAAIERRAERELTIHRALDGCQFRVDSESGVVRIAGRVQHELQKDVAIQLLRGIDGVKEVRSNLNR